MEYFLRMLDGIAAVPSFVPLTLLPALLPVGAAVLALVGKKNWYRVLAFSLWAASFTLLCCGGNLAAAFAFSGLYCLFASLCALLLLLPSCRKKKADRAEAMYEKFHEDIGPAPAARPPKVCCFEDSLPEEGGADVAHALALAQKLKKEKLSPADRLELEAVIRTVEGCRRPLGREGQDLLNDSLASILRLTAKYRL